MAINVREKGKQGERDVVKMLNEQIQSIAAEYGIDPDPYLFERNQNQSASGGQDLTVVFGLCIEVKRQETLNISSWWLQAKRSADRTKSVPILLYRQNNKPWSCMMQGFVFVPGAQFKMTYVDMTIGMDDFLAFFRDTVRAHLTRIT
jgi:hypothetical protein